MHWPLQDPDRKEQDLSDEERLQHFRVARDQIKGRLEVLAQRQKLARDRLVFDEDVIELMATETERAASAYEDRKEALAACMKKVSDKQVGLLNCHYTMNHSLREIAASEGRSLSAVKMNLMRLRQSLRSCINQQLQAT